MSELKERKCYRCDNVFVPGKPNQQVCDAEHFKDCVVCGGKFPWDKRKKTCSTVCTAALRKQNSQDRKCKYCGENFKPGNHLAQYCDREHFSKCVVCGDEFKIVDINRVSKTCSASCASSLSHTESAKKNRVVKSVEKHGVEYPFQSEEVKGKIKDSLDTNPDKDFRIGGEKYSSLITEKYGVDNVSSLNEVKAKKITLSQAKYGTDNPFQSEVVKEKFKSTLKDRYGVESPLQSSIISERFKNSVSQSHGNRWINQLHIKNFDEYLDLKKWAIAFNKENKKKPSLTDAAEYFGVSTVTISVIKNREGLSPYFRIVGSKQEESFQEFLALNLPDVKYRHNDRTAIRPFELDFYFPDHNFAVEISPTSTHHSADLATEGLRNAFNSDEVKAPDYHLKKALASEAAGIELFTIFDWMPWEKSLNMVLHKLSGSKRKIYARKTKVHFIDKYEKQNKKIAKEVKEFINEIHILGFDGRGTQFFTYLEYDGEIIGAAGWGKPRNLSIKNLGKKRGTDVIELTRMCFKPGVSVPGGASRLLKHFIKFYPENLTSLITFSDYDLGYGNVYGTLGFDMIEKPVAQKNFVHPVLTKGEGANKVNFRIKSSSLHFAGADRLLKNVPGYVAVGMECQHTDVYHPNGGCLPTNPQIVESYGFLPVYDCGYKKWARTITDEERALNVASRASQIENTLF